MLQPFLHSGISHQPNLLGQIAQPADVHKNTSPGLEIYSSPLNEVNPENLKILKDGGTSFILSLCLLAVVLKDLIKELHQD
jgi:hypothetical protein